MTPRMGARLVDAGVLLVAALLSFLLLVYVGYGEANRTYPRFLAEKMTAQGELLQTAVDGYLRAGLPLRQFPGFRQIAEPILVSDRSIAAITAYDDNGVAFAAGAEVPRLPATEGDRQIRESKDWLQVALPLRSRFETVGEIAVTMPRDRALDAVQWRFPWLAGLAVLAAVAFAALAGLLGERMRNARLPWLGISYAVAFIAVAGALVATLVDLYAEGAQARAKALADSLAQRLKPIVAYHLTIDDFDGLDRALAEYRRLNPDVRAVGLTLGERVVIHTNPSAVGQGWHSDTDTFEYLVPIGAVAQGQVRVAVALPTEIVWRAVTRSVKNFAALFLASGLMAGLFLQLGRSLGRDHRGGDHEAALGVIRPVFFVAVFVENLAAGFLPQLLRGSAEAAGAGAGAASIAFTLYFVFFLVSLLPASHVADSRGPRPLVVGGALIAALGSLIPALTQAFEGFLVARALAGLGQGILFIGVQALVLAHAPPDKRTQAAAIIVFGFNGGMIAGAAIGSLLVNYLRAEGVFAVGAATALLLALYAAALVAPVRGARRDTVGLRAALGRMARDIPRALGNVGFLRTILLVGGPSKAVLTGIVAFALPLVLSGLGYPPEDIGQIIMLYAAGVMLASGPVARLVDRTGRSGSVLVVGMLVSGLAMALVGSAGWAGLPDILHTPLGMTLLVAGGTLLLGLAHGCINAPVITHVSSTGAARRLGANGAAALYRVLERVGHVAGPMLGAQLLALAGTGPIAILWAGVAMIVLALIFAVPVRDRHG